jgi:hypothetical protein
VTLRDAESGGEESDDGVVGGAFDRGCGYPQQQGAVAGPRASGLAGAWDDADVEFDARAGLPDQDAP